MDEFWRMFDNGKPEQREKIIRLMESGDSIVKDEDLLFGAE